MFSSAALSQQVRTGLDSTTERLTSRYELQNLTRSLPAPIKMLRQGHQGEVMNCLYWILKEKKTKKSPKHENSVIIWLILKFYFVVQSTFLELCGKTVLWHSQKWKKKNNQRRKHEVSPYSSLSLRTPRGPDSTCKDVIYTRCRDEIFTAAAVNNLFSDQFGTRGLLEIWIMPNKSHGAILWLCFFSPRFKTNSHLLQLFRRLPQRCSASEIFFPSPVFPSARRTSR